MNCKFADGSTIPSNELTQVRQAIWKHMVVNQWHQGDIVYPISEEENKAKNVVR